MLLFIGSLPVALFGFGAAGAVFGGLCILGGLICLVGAAICDHLEDVTAQLKKLEQHTPPPSCVNPRRV